MVKSERVFEMSGPELVKYDAMCRAIAEAHGIDEVKNIRDKAKALQAYARQIGNTEAEDQCYRIRMRAQRKAGELSKQIETASGVRTDLAAGGGEVVTKQATLDDAGISRQQASEWERLSEVPEDQFEAALAKGVFLPARRIIDDYARRNEQAKSGEAPVVSARVVERELGPILSDEQFKADYAASALRDIYRIENELKDEAHLCDLLRPVRDELMRIQSAIGG
jgi:hypothetical protein